MEHCSKHIAFTLLLVLLPMVHCPAVEPNPTLAARFILCKNSAERALEKQRYAQELVAEGHVFVGREIQATNEYLREFNDYLDKFHDAISLAADLYGIYYEIKRTVNLTKQVSSVLSDAPTNAIAVMLRPNSSGMYGTIINTSIEVAQDIYNACLSKHKRTEQDRNKILTNVRKKIGEVNRQLTQLVIVLKYTTLEDIWHSIRQRAKYMDRERKHTLIERCYDNWKHNIR